MFCGIKAVTYMKESVRMTQSISPNKGWRVTFAGTGINLALGVLYTWSVIKEAIPMEWGWTAAQKSDPYAVACFVFAIAMIPAGRLQDKIGPRWVATIGGVSVALGCVLAGLAGSSYIGFLVGFGVFGGIGIGFGYAAATPAAVKWFPASQTGMIAGLVVAGFGLASVYIAPTAQALLGAYGVSTTMMIFGVAFFVIVVSLSQFLRNPPAGYIPFDAKADQRPTTTAASRPPVDMEWHQMIRTTNFWMLWTMYAFGAAAGLMVIGSAASMSKAALGPSAFVAVVVLSVGNAGGRVLAGVASDIIGRQLTLFFAFLMQAGLVLIPVYHGDDSIALLFAVTMIGACYGANLTLFPSATKDHFGMKSFGLNYGVMFTAWGVGGLILPRVAGMAKDITGKEDLAFYIASGLMVCGAILALTNLAMTRSKGSRKKNKSTKRHRRILPGHHVAGA
jgi:OFA family oxalate/formate antiporter-like MFS transporter